MVPIVVNEPNHGRDAHQLGVNRLCVIFDFNQVTELVVHQSAFWNVLHCHLLFEQHPRGFWNILRRHLDALFAILGGLW